MDPKTIQTYDKEASELSKKHQASTPTRLYALAQTFFRSGAPTADLGCGIGRDTFWLTQNGYPTTGFDASEGMLEIARKNHPGQTFIKAALPSIEDLKDKFENIFCCAVLMHIPRDQLVSAVINMLNALQPGGRLILSYRQGKGETDGRLFETYHPGQIAQLFESLGGKVLLMEEEGIWNNLVIERADLNKRQGIQLIQHIITRDKKVATYKFALLRALCEISRYEPHVVTWHRDADMVLVPMKRIAARWVYYYFPLVKHKIRQTTSEKMAFQDQLAALPFKTSDLAILRNQIESKDNSKEIQGLLRKISNTIKVGPIQYAGGGKFDIFNFVSSLDASIYPELKESDFGMVSVPLSLWRDMSLFSHWIEDSLSIQWAELSEKINKDGKFAQHLDLITKSVQEDERSTNLVRKLFEGKPIECVWTGKKLGKFDVDHMIPWSMWRNNDLWNLLPTDPKVNNRKRDLIPSTALVRKRFDSIKAYWEVYEEKYPDLFESQIERSLGLRSGDVFSKAGLEAIEQTLIRVNLNLGGGLWEDG